jgi:hypothetical protein
MVVFCHFEILSSKAHTPAAIAEETCPTSTPAVQVVHLFIANLVVILGMTAAKTIPS